MVAFRRLHLAFADGRKVRTGGGVGILQRRQLADLVLPTGVLTLGYPGTPPINVPSTVHPEVPPGAYPTFISFAQHIGGHKTFAYLSIRFSDEPVRRWTSAGRFFTDSGSGCVVDRSLEAVVRERGSRDGDEFWRIKNGVYDGGDGSLLLGTETSANAIIFRTLDWEYQCFAGNDPFGRPAWLVIDGRYPRWWEPSELWR